MARLMDTFGIDRLSVDDRLQLLEEIWDSLDLSEPPPLTDNQKAEIDRRLADLDTDPSIVITWDEIVAHARAQR